MDAAVPWSLKLRTGLLLLMLCLPGAAPAVSYDHRSLIIDGNRRILFSGSIHYPRSTPEMWPELVQKAKDGGLDVIQTYVFWNGHEPSPGKYNFSGRYDLVRFVKTVQRAGLYVHLRIGPYVCAEWNFGGFPVWLKYVPGMAFRTDNSPFKDAMQGFTGRIVKMMKAEKLFHPQGGPIILSQIENEYDTVEGKYGEAGKAFVKWAASTAVSLQTGVPWVMCKGQDAPDPIINTCNGFYCQDFEPNSKQKPKFWTEAWTGWLTNFGETVPYRPVEDLAYAAALFVQNGGSFINYYMYHGGTNFERTAGGPFITTSYDYDAPIDEYGLLRQPKWGHLKDLHVAIKQCEAALVSADHQITKIGDKQEAHVFESTSSCAAFLSNNDPNYSANVTFRDNLYELPPWSVSILPGCMEEKFNTAKVHAPSLNMKMNPVDVGPLSWQYSSEEIPSALDRGAVHMGGLLEQLSITRDTTDYLWYMTTVEIKHGDIKEGDKAALNVESAGHALHAFINGKLLGTANGNAENPKLTFQGDVQLTVGTNRVSLLSVSVGLANVGFQFERWGLGVCGPVTLDGVNGGARNLSKQTWTYQVGLKGEAITEWQNGPDLPRNQPLTWYRTSFNLPEGSEPLALDMNSMKKGMIWVNGNNLGRYWSAFSAQGTCSNCHYAGTYNQRKCRTNCGQATQRWYHIPRSWLKPRVNSLVVLEEIGGDPRDIVLVKRTA